MSRPELHWSRAADGPARLLRGATAPVAWRVALARRAPAATQWAARSAISATTSTPPPTTTTRRAR